MQYFALMKTAEPFSPKQNDFLKARSLRDIGLFPDLQVH